MSGRLLLDEGSEMAMPGDTVLVAVQVLAPVAIEEGLGFAVREGGRTVAAGTVLKLLD
ncbi:MAG TPA: hypothetical protein VMD59_22860 [Acidimicrobiales bacterium]|nr:hypothetical protein [Acidimicrobiales bacterium]